MKEKNIRELARRMELVTPETMRKYSIPQLVLMIANKVNELIDVVGRFESDVVEVVKTQNENIKYLLDKGLIEDVTKVFDKWVKDGTFDTLINQTALQRVHNRIDEIDTLTHRKPNLIDVTNYGVKNDGSPIGKELNQLIDKNKGKTIYFPDGVYVLTEPIVTHWRYDEHVHLSFSKEAIVKSNTTMDALLRIGFKNVDGTFDRSQRRFNYIEGGKFDCSNVLCGIEVNGLKQLVFLKDINLYKGKAHHIRINNSNEFTGTGSADVKLQNIHIQGLSSNEDNCGVYIDGNCADCKLEHLFIYGCKRGIVTKSSGHYLNNIHVLSQVTKGGIDLGSNNFVGTVGLDIESGGQFLLNNFYFDTVETCIYTHSTNPKLSLVNCYFFSYLSNYGDSFFKRDSSVSTTLELYMVNCTVDIKKQDYKLLNANIPFGFDPYNRTQIINLTLGNREKLYKFDPYLSQKIRGVNDDYLIRTDNKTFDTNWVVLGLFPDFDGETKFTLSYSVNRSTTLYFTKHLESLTSEIRDTNNSFFFDLGKATLVENGKNYTALLFRPKGQSTGFPIMTTERGVNGFMRTPTDAKKFTLTDYSLSESDVTIIVSK